MLFPKVKTPIIGSYQTPDKISMMSPRTKRMASGRWEIRIRIEAADAFRRADHRCEVQDSRKPGPATNADKCSTGFENDWRALAPPVDKRYNRGDKEEIAAAML